MSTRILNQFIFLSFAFLTFSYTSAQITNLKFEHLTVENGLSQDVVTSIIQDRSGYMWFGTQDGLNKYNGYNFKVYKNNPFDSTSLSDAWIQVIAEDDSGNIWAGTQSSGVFVYDRVSGKFTHYSNKPGKENSLINNRVWTIKSDKKGIIWIGTSGGLDRFDIQKKIFNHYTVHNGSLNNNAVNSIFEDRAGFIWAGTFGGGLNKIRPGRNAGTDSSGSGNKVFKFKAGHSKQDGINYIKTIFSESDSVLWLGTLNGLVRFETHTGNYSSFFPVDPAESEEPNQNYIMSIADAGKGKLWIGTHNSGLNLFDKLTGRFIKIVHNPLDNESLSDNYVRAIFKDRTGILWVGTGRGINKRIPNSQNFVNLKHIKGKESTLSADEITSIITDKKGTIWVGTWGGGLNSLDRGSNIFKHYKYRRSDSRSLPDNIVWCTYIDRENNFWVGTYAGISRFNRASGTFDRRPFGKAELSHNNISAIYQDNAGTLWVGTWGGGLNRYDKRLNKFFYYKNNPADSGSISDDFITGIFQDKSGNLWIATNGGGLNRYDYTKDRFYRYMYNPNDPASLSSNNVRSIFEGSSGKLWIGTWGGGINEFDFSTGTFKSYTEKNGLANNVVYGILQDNNGNLWISTDAGLSRFNTKNRHFITYEKKDGTGNYQYGSGYSRAGDGLMIFGGVNGLTMFYPGDISVNKNPPPVVITSFKIFNNDLKLGKTVSETKEIELSYSDNVFSIGFAALDYTRPDKNMYRYKLKEFEKRWIYSGSDRTASYTNLNPGTYVFTVQASNNDNVWNETGTSLIIRIIPPFWATWWFRGAATLVLLLLIFTAYKIRIKNIKRRNAYLQKIVREKTYELENEINVRKQTETALRTSEEQLKELNASKDKFFSIISHDLKSPFFALLGYTEYLEEDFEQMNRNEIKSIVGNINKILKRLAVLTDNLLNWSKFKLGRIDFEPVEANLKDVAESALSVIEINAVKKKIDIENNIDSGIEIYADKDLMISVIQNLVANAIKFSRAGGKVIISSAKKTDVVEVSISDNGVGISRENLDNLFKIDITHSTVGTEDEQGSGLGLIVCKESVERNGGTIRAESEPGKGSTFTFSVPLFNKQ